MNSTHKFHRPDLEAEDMQATTRQLERDLRRVLDEQSVIIDVGANRGQFAQEILGISPVRRIYSFEPVSAASNELEALAVLHPEIVPIRKAVSTENGSASFFVTASDVGSSLLQPLPGQPSKWLTLEQEVKVETQRLDDFICNDLPDEFRQIALLKSDAQGSDLDVLRSAGEYLNPAHIRAVLVEINFSAFYQGQQLYHEIFALLEKAGYRMAWMYPHRAHDEWLWWADVLFIGR
jgi:FkbM family methyltransferase